MATRRNNVRVCRVQFSWQDLKELKTTVFSSLFACKVCPYVIFGLEVYLKERSRAHTSASRRKSWANYKFFERALKTLHKYINNVKRSPQTYFYIYTLDTYICVGVCILMSSSTYLSLDCFDLRGWFVWMELLQDCRFNSLD